MFVFDFDGTIVDVWRRFYNVFLMCVDGSDIPFEIYVKRKRQLVDDALVAKSLGCAMLEMSHEIKLASLESSDMLSLDCLLIAPEKLIELIKCTQSIVLTKRRNEFNFRQELDRLGLSALHDRSYVIPPDSGISKALWLKSWLANKKIEAVFGDSVEDMLAANEVGAKAIMVRSGLREESYVKARSKVDEVYDVLADVVGK